MEFYCSYTYHTLIYPEKNYRGEIYGEALEFSRGLRRARGRERLPRARKNNGLGQGNIVRILLYVSSLKTRTLDNVPTPTVCRVRAIHEEGAREKALCNDNVKRTIRGTLKKPRTLDNVSQPSLVQDFATRLKK